jgi:hypothetical protein
MAEPLDVYADQFQLSTAIYGATLNFLVSSPTPPAPGTAPPIERLATVRMSLEHLKVMAFILRRQVLQHEQQTGTTIQIAAQALNGLQIGLEDWERFWRE